jgi:hypothetical protein
VTIITITPMIVAAADKRIMNLEKERCPRVPGDLLNAMRFAIKPATFKLNCLSLLVRPLFFKMAID